MTRALLPAARVAMLLAAAMAAASGTAQAQEGPTGIAFAYVAEQGSGVCTGGSPAAALDCARERCMEATGALPQDCARVAWCFPAGWSVAVGVMHVEGIHWTEISCGWPSREAALAAGAVRCDRALRENVQECVVGQLWNERGEPITPEDAT